MCMLKKRGAGIRVGQNRPTEINLTVPRWGVTFFQIAALTKYHRGPRGRHPMSRLLAFVDTTDRLKLDVYLHDDSF